MSVAEVVFVPAAPLLVPAVAGGAAGLDAQMREASLAAVAAALNGRDTAVVVAAADPAGQWSDEATWDFSGFGVPRPPTGRDRLPWTLGIGAWLLDECGWEGPRHYVGLAGDGGTVADAATAAGSVAVVVVGDGSACRTEKAPGYLDERAEAFDATIEAALGAGDAAGLTSLDESLATELRCRSLPAWRWVAGALGGAGVSSAAVTFAAAPYGVAYFVAGWTLSTD